MSDRAAAGLAVAAALGAWLAWAVPLPVGLAVIAAGFATRRPVLLVVAGFLVTSTLSARSWSGLVPPERGERVRGTATLLTDPEWSRFGQLQAEVRVGSRRMLASARGMAASRLVTRMAGERVAIDGRLRPVTGRAAAHLHRRHIATHLDVQAAGERPDPGNPFDRLANRVRRLLDRGSTSMAPDHRALFAGFLLGDDRNQAPETVYDFRASGLSHLLAVSGQNVAFILALAAPLLRRLRLTGRLAAGTIVLVVFGVLTRWEPTVLRAVAMAAVALIATTLGRPASSVRLLALAVTALLLIDPLLVGSVGFQLSVAASAGIVVLAPRLRHRLPGPRVVAEPLAVTVAAQAAVAPILVTTFDAVPLASLPANLLAGPAAAPITMWGLVAGLAAGVVGEPVASLLHLPTRLFIGWVAEVATQAASVPLGDLGRTEVVALAALVALWVVWPRRRPIVFGAGLLVVVVSALAPALTPPGSSTGDEVVPGARLWRTASTTVVVVDRPDPVTLLTGLRRARVHRIDALVVTSASVASREVVGTVTRRVPTRLVVHPPPPNSRR